MPWNGNSISIGNSVEAIPADGVTLSSTSLTADTNYYVYAYMDTNDAMALEASVDGYSIDSVSGIVTKNNDTSRSLVGMVYPVSVDSATQFVNDDNRRFVLSWYNRRKILSHYKADSEIVTTFTYDEVNDDMEDHFGIVSGPIVEWIDWGIEPFTAGVMGMSTGTGQHTNFAVRLIMDDTHSTSNKILAMVGKMGH